METSPPPQLEAPADPAGDELKPLLPKQAARSVGVSPAYKVAASCVGFIADSYDLFTIDLVVPALELQYGEAVIGAREKSLMVSLMLAGVIIGQLSFGFVADWVGRKWAFVTTAGITIVGAVLSACVQPSETSWNLPTQLALCRLLLGIGVGGEYPLSATVTAEAAEDPFHRGRMMALVISMQGFGMLLSSVVALIALSANVSIEVLWRLLLAFGAVPSVVAFGLRWHLHESEAFESCRQAASAGGGRRKDWFSSVRQYWLTLAGTAGIWLLMNVFQYSLGSFKSTILMDIFPEGVGRERIMNVAKFSAITSAFAIGGFGLGHVFVVYLRRYTMQLGGFLAVAVVFFVVGGLAAAPGGVSGETLLLLLGLMFFFLNSGPNITTFVLPAEAFPTKIRASCHGISAASGKVGAVIGTAVLPPSMEAFGLSAVYIACGIIALLATLGTYLLTPRETVALSTLDASIKDDT